MLFMYFKAVMKSPHGHAGENQEQKESSIAALALPLTSHVISCNNNIDNKNDNNSSST